MSAKSERKKAIKEAKRATYGFPSAWQRFKNQLIEDRTVQRAEVKAELQAALQTVIRHGSPVFTPRHTTERG